MINNSVTIICTNNCSICVDPNTNTNTSSNNDPDTIITNCGNTIVTTNNCVIIGETTNQWLH